MTDIGWLELGRTLPYFELTMWVIKKLSNGYGLASVSQTTEFEQGIRSSNKAQILSMYDLLLKFFGQVDNGLINGQNKNL